MSQITYSNDLLVNLSFWGYTVLIPVAPGGRISLGQKIDDQWFHLKDVHGLDMPVCIQTQVMNGETFELVHIDIDRSIFDNSNAIAVVYEDKDLVVIHLDKDLLESWIDHSFRSKNMDTQKPKNFRKSRYRKLQNPLNVYN